MSGNLQISLRMSRAEILAVKKFCEGTGYSVAAYVKFLLKKNCPALNVPATNVVSLPRLAVNEDDTLAEVMADGPLFDPETGLFHVDADGGVD